MLERLAKWWKSQLDVQRLESLDSHLLADMGLTREVIEDRVRGKSPHVPVPALSGAPRGGVLESAPQVSAREVSDSRPAEAA